MLFTTDQQTVEDLNIFGKHAGTSVYELFNRTYTRGGSVLLEEMFQFPLSDAAAINRRSSLIRYFSDFSHFPLDSQLPDIIDQYLTNKDERTKLADDGDSIGHRLTSLVLEDDNYKFVYKGVTSIITVFNDLRKFIGRQEDVPVTSWQKEKEAIRQIIDDAAFAFLAKEDPKSKLSYARLSAYDQVLRFREREKIKKLLRCIYQIDVFISVGKIARDQGFTFPEALPAEMQKMELDGLRHPGMPGAVTNSFQLTPNSNVTFLTGANMAGKSTFMKSLGIALYLAHMGFPVAATKMEFSVLDGIYTTINLSDNISMGASHFYAEVLRVKKVVRELKLGRRLLVIIDELFRGTNVKDAFEATIAVTGLFAAKRSSLFVISTHIIEAGEVLKAKHENINFRYLPTYMEGNTPVYTRRLAEGITADRHGMVIINNEGILEILKKGRRKL